MTTFSLPCLGIYSHKLNQRTGKKLLGSILSVFLAFASVPALAASLLNVQAGASSTAGNATGVTYTLQYTTVTALTSSDNLLIAGFPIGITLPPVAFGNNANCVAAFSVKINGVAQDIATLISSNCGTFASNNIQLHLNTGQSVASGSVVEVGIINATNPAIFPVGAMQSFTTNGNSGTTIDSANPLPTMAVYVPYSPTPPAPAPVPTLSEWAMITLAMLIAGFGIYQQRRRQL